jgi:hypothetical protein
LREAEKEHWQKLVDSNIRSGTLACLWCLKAQYVKKLSMAFSKWRLFSALRAMEMKKETSLEYSNNAGDFGDNDDDSPRKAASIALQNAIEVMNRIKPLHPSDPFPWEARRAQRNRQGDVTSNYNEDTYDSRLEKTSFEPLEDVNAEDITEERHNKSFSQLTSALLDQTADAETKRQMLCKPFNSNTINIM